MLAFYTATLDTKEKEDQSTEIYTARHRKMNDVTRTVSRGDIMNCKEATGNPGIHREHKALISDSDK